MISPSLKPIGLSNLGQSPPSTVHQRQHFPNPVDKALGRVIVFGVRPAVSGTQHWQRGIRAAWGFLSLSSLQSSSVVWLFQFRLGQVSYVKNNFAGGFVAMYIPCTSTGADCHFWWLLHSAHCILVWCIFMVNSCMEWSFTMVGVKIYYRLIVWDTMIAWVCMFEMTELRKLLR
jgi:hypothetical protein